MRRHGHKRTALEQAIVDRAKVLATPPPPPEKPILKAVIKRNRSQLIRIQDAFTRMEITMEEVESFPAITAAFDDIGGVLSVIAYLRASDQKEAKTLVRYWDQCPPSTRDILPFEAFVVAAKCSRKRMLQIVIGEVSEQSSAEAVLLAAVKHKAIVQKTVDVALSDDDGADSARKMLLQHRKFLPIPKNQVVNIGELNDNRDQRDQRSQSITFGSLDEMKGKIGKGMDRFNQERLVDPTSQEYIPPPDVDEDEDE